ncbi:hypothetical protein ARSEF1564_007714 [Beauveria bassiana]
MAISSRQPAKQLHAKSAGDDEDKGKDEDEDEDAGALGLVTLGHF